MPPTGYHSRTARPVRSTTVLSHRHVPTVMALTHTDLPFFLTLPALRPSSILPLSTIIWAIGIVTNIPVAMTTVESSTVATPVSPTACPHECVCDVRLSKASGFPSKTVNCHDKGYNAAPRNLSTAVETLLLRANRFHLENLGLLTEFANLTELDLSQNHIYDLEDARGALPALRYLTLDDNLLDYIGNGSFSWAPGLVALSMQRNKLELMAVGAFRGLAELTSLDLSGNRLYDVTPGWFSHTGRLTRLRLAANNIHVVGHSAFHYLRRLRSLDLSNNGLQVMYDTAFNGLVSLEQLSLSGNSLKSIPLAAIQGVGSLLELDLSANAFTRLQPGAMADSNVTHLRLSHLHLLKFIDQGAFVRLGNLRELSIGHNRALCYIDPGAFRGLPSLQVLRLNNNNMTTVDQDLLEGLAALRTLDISANPLYCDCSLKWIRDVTVGRGDVIVEQPSNGGDSRDVAEGGDEDSKIPQNLTLSYLDAVICHGPPSLSGVLLAGKARSETTLSNTTANIAWTETFLEADSPGVVLPESCPPRVLPLFPQDYHAELGDPVRLECRASGLPRPKMDWFLPHPTMRADGSVLLTTGPQQQKQQQQQHGRPANLGVYDVTDHINITSLGSLVLEYVQGTDHGVYVCVADNTLGAAQLSVHLAVKTDLASVIITRVSHRSVTLTWRATSFDHSYVILYRKQQANATYHKPTVIRPYMRSYTANSLQPDTMYQFCIALRQAGRTVRINCTTVLTKRAQTSAPQSGMFNARAYIIGGVAATVVMVVFLTCLVTSLVRRYNNRKRDEEELYSDNLSNLFLASMDTMSDLSPMTYENRGADMFDNDDIDEIHSTASMGGAACSGVHTTVIK